MEGWGEGEPVHTLNQTLTQESRTGMRWWGGGCGGEEDTAAVGRADWPRNSVGNSHIPDEWK